MQRCCHEEKAVVMQISDDADEAEENQLNHDEDKAVVMQRCTQVDVAVKTRCSSEEDEAEEKQ